MTLMRSGELGQRLYLVKHERDARKRGDMGGAGSVLAGEPTSGDARCLYRIVNSKVCQTRRVSQNLDTSTIPGPTLSLSGLLAPAVLTAFTALQMQTSSCRDGCGRASRWLFEYGIHPEREREKRKSRRGSCQATLRRVQRALSITVASALTLASHGW